MLPVMFSIGPVKVYSMGVFLLVAILLGLFVSWKKAKEYHVDDNDFFDVSFGVLWWGLVGARLFYVFEHFGDFGFNLLKWLWMTNYVGLSFWGGLIGGLIALVVLVNIREQEVFEWLDFMSLGLVLGVAFGMIGAFFNGSFLGRSVAYGVSMPGVEGGSFPIQLLMAVLFFMAFFVFWWMEGEYRTFWWYRGGRSNARPGLLWFVTLGWIGLIFGLSVFLRHSVQSWGWFRVEWLWAIPAFLSAFVGVYIRSGRSRTKRVVRR